MASATLPHDQPQFNPGDYVFRRHPPFISGHESEFFIMSLNLLMLVHDSAIRHGDITFAGRVANLCDQLRTRHGSVPDGEGGISATH